MDNVIKVNHCTIGAEPLLNFHMLLCRLPVAIIILIIKEILVVIHILESHFFLLPCFFLQGNPDPNVICKFRSFKERNYYQNQLNYYYEREEFGEREGCY